MPTWLTILLSIGYALSVGVYYAATLPGRYQAEKERYAWAMKAYEREMARDLYMNRPYRPDAGAVKSNAVHDTLLASLIWPLFVLAPPLTALLVGAWELIRDGLQNALTAPIDRAERVEAAREAQRLADLAAARSELDRWTRILFNDQDPDHEIAKTIAPALEQRVQTLEGGASR